MHQVDVFVHSSFSLNHEPFRSVTYYLMEEHRFHGHQGDSHSLHPVQQIEAEIIGYAEDQQQAESLVRSSYFKSLDYKKTPAKTGGLLVDAKLIFKLVKS